MMFTNKHNTFTSKHDIHPRPQEITMNTRQTLGYTAAISLALAMTNVYAADNNATSTPSASTNSAQPMTGKEKATAIGAGSGAVAGAVVGGPVGAVVGAGIGAVVGHKGTDANGHVDTNGHASGMKMSDTKVRDAQAALNEKGFSVGSVDGRWGPNTENAVRQFQASKGLTASGQLDAATMSALGVNS
jgi:uncharacterized membrane protein